MSTSASPANPWHAALGFLILLGVGLLAAIAFRSSSKPAEDPNIAEARRQVATWADQLDRDTTDAGVYRRWPRATLPETDPWGRELTVDYSQGGVAEMLVVRSAGPDGVARTADDVQATRSATNLKGIGAGIKSNAEETAKNAAKGTVNGLVEGAKMAIGKGK
jgi:hypothetical protein